MGKWEDIFKVLFIGIVLLGLIIWALFYNELLPIEDEKQWDTAPILSVADQSCSPPEQGTQG